jgi:DNA-binding response OmpR family regulator
VRIIVAEDEEQLGAAIARGLRENTYAVDVATDAATALTARDVHFRDIDFLYRVADLDRRSARRHARPNPPNGSVFRFTLPTFRP